MALIVVLALLLKRYEIDLSVTYAIIVVAPLLIYLILSGDVSEIAGPGGISAKFKADARAPVDATAEIEALELVAKAAMNPTALNKRPFRPGAPIALTLRLADPASFYDRYAIENYILALNKVDADVTVIFISVDGLFKASTDGAAVLSIVNNDHFGQEMQDAIQTGDVAKLRTILPISEKAVEKAESNARALKKMIDAGVKSLVAVDASGRPVGVVRRDRIVATLVSSLAG